jgi:hypothetical protein
MVKFVCISLFILHCVIGISQENYIQPGILKASATISPSKMLNRPVDNIYLSGFLEYHLDKKLSLRGDSYFFIDSKAEKATDEVLNGASRTFFGLFYHFNKSNWDKYLGVQPGLSLLRFSAISSGISFSPSFAVTAGTSYFVWDYFHFFANLTYVNSTVRQLQGGSRKADELILSAGLGFQLPTKK